MLEGGAMVPPYEGSGSQFRDPFGPSCFAPGTSSNRLIAGSVFNQLQLAHQLCRRDQVVVTHVISKLDFCHVFCVGC